jgi:hypothetical protein
MFYTHIYFVLPLTFVMLAIGVVKHSKAKEQRIFASKAECQIAPHLENNTRNS